MTRESIFDENGELAASFCPTEVPLSDKGRAALEALVKAVRKDMAAKSPHIDLEAVERRSDRFVARLSGKQEGSTPIAAQQSALDVPDLLAEVRRLKAVEAAAKVWRICRHEEISGDVFHRACVALSEAVAALNGDLDRPPVAPPSEEELEGGRELVRRAKAYSSSAGGRRAADEGKETNRDH